MKTILIPILALSFIQFASSQVADSLPKESIEVVDKNTLDAQMKVEKSFQSGKSQKVQILKISPFTPMIASEITSIRTPEITYERQIRPDITWTLSAFGTIRYSGNFDPTAATWYQPGLKAGIRYYYNMNDRMLSNKPVAKFSANYFGGHLGNDFDDVLYNVVWGMQRSIGNRFFYDFNAGFQKETKLLQQFDSWNSGYFIVMNIQFGILF
jgi:hypothetical protein